MRWLALLLCLCAVHASAVWNVAVEFRVVQVPVSAGVEIVEQFSDERTTPGAVTALDALVQNGKATLVAELFGKAVSGTSLNLESVELFQYPTEYDTPHPKFAPQPGSGLGIPAAPNTMETKSLGPRLLCEATVSENGEFILGKLRCGVVRHVGDIRCEYGVRWDGLKYFLDMPKFATRVTDTDLVFRTGTPTLVGSFLVGELPGQMELHLVTLKSSRVGEATPRDGDVEVHWNTRLDLKRYHLSPEDGARARAAISRGDEKPEAVMQKLVNEGKATLSECSSFPSIAGGQDAQENVLEVRYPTDFDYPDPNWRWGVPDAVIAQRLAEKKKILRSFFKPPRLLDNLDFPPTNPPTTFEVKNTGSTIQSEIAPSSDMEGAVLVNLVSKAVNWNGFTRRLQSVKEQGDRVYDYQPKFTTRETKENRTLPVGKWVLQAFHRRPTPHNDTELTIARIKTNKVHFIHKKP